MQPKRELEPFCTFASIRKLLALALSLDGYRRDEKQRAALWPADSLDGDPECIWASEQMAETLTIARRIAPTPLSVLVTGETGTGKEMLAEAIHRASDRADRLFLPFNCTAVPRDMLESQLFGYRKGRLHRRRDLVPGRHPIGRGRHAVPRRNRRDRSGDSAQAAAVPRDPRDSPARRAAPDHRGRPRRRRHQRQRRTAGGGRTVPRGPVLPAQRGPATLPPLRERREEIPPLVQHYLRKYCDEQKKGRLTISDETLEYLLLFSWPGNVRQLANEVRRMVALAEPDSTLTPALLSPEIQASRRTLPAIAPVEAEVARGPRSAAAGRRRDAGADDGPARARPHPRPGRGSLAAARHLAQGPVPQAATLGIRRSAS